jgi:hypothetical protein
MNRLRPGAREFHYLGGLAASPRDRPVSVVRDRVAHWWRRHYGVQLSGRALSGCAVALVVGRSQADHAGGLATARRPGGQRTRRWPRGSTWQHHPRSELASQGWQRNRFRETNPPLTQTRPMTSRSPWDVEPDLTGLSFLAAGGVRELVAYVQRGEVVGRLDVRAEPGRWRRPTRELRNRARV